MKFGAADHLSARAVWCVMRRGAGLLRMKRERRGFIAGGVK